VCVCVCVCVCVIYMYKQNMKTNTNLFSKASALQKLEHIVYRASENSKQKH
jgi:hypothetical protein